MARSVASISLIRDKETIAKIQQVKRLVNSEAVQDMLLPAAQVVRDIARRLVNIGPGKSNSGAATPHLRDLIFAVKGRKPRSGFYADAAQVIYGDDAAEGPSVIAGINLKRAPHAHLVEFGHGGPHPAPPHPFLRPAAIAARPLVRQIIEDGLKRLLAPFSA
jgi:HK97 gp10 family phage protein